MDVGPVGNRPKDPCGEPLGRLSFIRMKFSWLLAAFTALASPARAGTVAAAEAGEASLVPSLGPFSSPLTAGAFTPASTPGLVPMLAAANFTAPNLVPVPAALTPSALVAVKPAPTAGAQATAVPVIPAALTPALSAASESKPDQENTRHDGAAMFDGAMMPAKLKDSLSFIREPGPDGMISVPYGRQDWVLKASPFAYESFASAAAEHRAAVRTASPDADPAGLKVSASYSAILQTAGVKVLPTQYAGRDGITAIGILIVPDARGHRLNRVAARLAAAGVKMIFSPRVAASNPARFELTNTEVFLFMPNLDLGFPGEALRHELRHFGFFKGLLRGRVSLLHAYFTPKPGRLTADDARAYGEYLALEEVATYSHQVRAMLRIVAANPTPDGLKELREQLAVLREVARIARGLIAEAKAESEAGTAVLSSSPIGDATSFLNVELARGRLALGVKPHEVAGEYSTALALKRRLAAWEVLLDALEPAASALGAALEGSPDWKSLRTRGDALTAAITRGEAAWR